MATIKLLEPVRGSLTSLRFFNGRLLTGSDLTREQQTVYHRDERLGAALGSGVLNGLNVALDPTVEGQPPSVQITAGQAISPTGDLLALPEAVQLILEIPTPPPPKGNPDWRRCVSESSDTPLPARRLYLLTMRPSPRDSLERAHVLQIDRSTDPCTTSFLEEAVVFRLIHMRSLEAVLTNAQVSDAHLRSAVAHACLATSDNPGAIEALRREPDIDMDHDVALAVVHLRPDARWLDTWSVRRSVAPQPAHHPISASTGPRDRLEAEARLLQFQAQLAQLVAPIAPTDPAALDGRASADFQWLPPAGELPMAWGDAWRHFLGPWLAPAIAYPCDARILPALLESAAMAASIAPTPADDSAPAVDVYVGRAAGEGPDLARIYVHSPAARALASLGPAELLSDSVLAGLKVRLLDADGLQSWAMRRNPDRLVWLSPDVPPGTYTVEIDSAEVGAEPVTVHLIGGRVRRGQILVEPRTGILDIEIRGDFDIQGLQVRARQDAHIMDARPNGARRWLIVGVPPGEWTVTASGTANGDAVSRDADTVVEVDTTTQVTLEFVADVPAPARTLNVPIMNDGRRIFIKLSMIEVSITDTVGNLSMELKTAGYYSAQRAQADSTAFRDPERLAPIKSLFLRPTYDTKIRGAYDESRDSVALYKALAFKKPAQGVVLNPPEEILVWLRQWQRWLAHIETSAQVRRSILNASPHLEVENGQTLLTLAARPSPPATAEAWAVFGPTRLPIIVVRERARIFSLAPSSDLTKRLERFQRARFAVADYPVDVLGSLPKDLLDLFFNPDDIHDLGDEIIKIAELEKATGTYLPGLTPELSEKIGGFASNIVLLANASPADLGINSLAAKMLIAEARNAVPAELWSAHAAGISDEFFDRASPVILGDLARGNTDRLARSDFNESLVSNIRETASAALLNGVAAEAFSTENLMPDPAAAIAAVEPSRHESANVALRGFLGGGANIRDVHR